MCVCVDFSPHIINLEKLHGNVLNEERVGDYIYIYVVDFLPHIVNLEIYIYVVDFSPHMVSLEKSHKNVLTKEKGLATAFIIIRVMFLRRWNDFIG